MADDPGFGRFTEESRRFVRLSATMEPAQLRLARAAMRRLGLGRFIDIGANVGLYSIYVGLLDRRPAIEAFEPSAATAAALEANLALNPSVRARIHRVALSDHAGVAAFDQRQTLGTGARIDPAGGDRVTLARLDDVLPLKGRRDAAMKIDVEGHELSVLAGGAEFISRRVAYAQVESWSPKRRAEVREAMAGYGLRFALRVKGDQIFLHDSRYDECAEGLQDLAAKASSEAFSVAGRLAREGARALRDPAFRAEARALYNGFDDLAIGRRGLIRRILGL